MNPAPHARLKASLIAGAAALGLGLIAWCFAGYLTPSALASLLSGLAFCG